VIELMEAASKKIPGLFPVFINPSTGLFVSEAISFGGLGEYNTLHSNYFE